MGFKLEAELERGKQLSQPAVELHVCAQAQGEWGWLKMLILWHPVVLTPRW